MQKVLQTNSDQPLFVYIIRLFIHEAARQHGNFMLHVSIVVGSANQLVSD